jgi:hypothetical protein
MSVSPCAIAVRRSDRHGNHWSYTNKSSIKRVLLVASIANMLFSSNIGNVYAAGPYDGEWNGSATAVKNGRCKVGQCHPDRPRQRGDWPSEVRSRCTKHCRDCSAGRHLWRHNRLPAPHGEIRRAQFRRGVSELRLRMDHYSQAQPATDARERPFPSPPSACVDVGGVENPAAIDRHCPVFMGP